MRCVFSVLASGTLVAAGLAQTTIPQGYLTTPGVSFSAWPFGLSGPARLQYLYDAGLAGRAVTVISRIAFRGAPGRTAGAKKGLELQIAMSHSPVDIFSATTNWQANHGRDFKIVFTKKTIDIPAQPGSRPVQPFVTEFKLDTPFVYVRTRGGLIVDYIVTRNVRGAYTHDGEWNKAPSFTAIGTPCKGTMQTVSGARPINRSGTTTFRMAGGPAAGVAVHVLGAAPLPNPIPLPNGGCLLRIAPLLLLGATIANGSATVTYPTPVGLRTAPTFVFYGQWIAISTTGPWTASQGHKVSLGGFVNCGRILHTSSATARTAQRVQIGFAIIHRLR